MKHESYTKNGIHPITKLAAAPPNASPAKAKPAPEVKKPTAADKLYGKPVGLRGKPKE